MNKRHLIYLIILALTQHPFEISAQLPAYLPTNGLVAWYPFNGNVLNEYGISLNGYANAISLTTNRFNIPNTAFNFTGQIGEYIRVTNSSPIVQSSRTISLWMTAPTVYDDWYDNLFVPDDGEGIVANGGHPNYIQGNTSGKIIDVKTGITSLNALNNDNWHQITIIHDYENLTATLYVDGVENAFIYSPQLFASVNQIQSFTIGSAAPGLEDGHAVHQGKIDDLAIWNRALTSQEILNYYAESSNGMSTHGNSNGTTSTSPVPPGIPYQAEVRNESGEVLANANVNVRFTLHELTANGTVSYQETHTLTTNELGLFATTIGAGTATQGTFAGINWSQTTKFLQVEVDTGNGYITLGNQQLMSVPYALYAANSQPGPQGPVGPQGPAGGDGAQGVQGPQGPMGLTGLNGSNGKNSLLNSSIIPAGNNCANGGVRIDSGMDNNADGILQLSEIIETEYICNGLNGTNQFNNQPILTTYTRDMNSGAFYEAIQLTNNYEKWDYSIRHNNACCSGGANRQLTFQASFVDASNNPLPPNSYFISGSNGLSIQPNGVVTGSTVWNSGWFTSGRIQWNLPAGTTVKLLLNAIQGPGGCCDPTTSWTCVLLR